MELDQKRILSPRATDLARILLVGKARYRLKGNVITDLVTLLFEVGIDPEEIKSEHPVGGARIDTYVPRYRAIVETKAQGKSADPNRPQSWRSEPARAQLERYVTAESSGELRRLPLTVLDVRTGGRPLSRIEAMANALLVERLMERRGRG